MKKTLADKNNWIIWTWDLLLLQRKHQDLITTKEKEGISFLTVLVKIVIAEVMKFLISVIITVHSLKNTKRQNCNVVLVWSITLICHFPTPFGICSLCLINLFCCNCFLPDKSKILAPNVPKSNFACWIDNSRMPKTNYYERNRGQVHGVNMWRKFIPCDISMSNIE